MTKLKLNNSGFGVVELLLIVLAVIIFVLAGWYVYMHNHKSTSNVTNSTTSGSVSNPYKGWTSAVLTYEKISYKYPSNWTVTDKSVSSPQGSGGCAYPGQDKIYITSPSNDQVFIDTGECSGNTIGYYAFTKVPITFLGSKEGLDIVNNFPNNDQNAVPEHPAFAIVADDLSGNWAQAGTYSININSSKGSSAQLSDNFYYYPYNSLTSSAPSNLTASEIQNNQDFNTAKLIFESMTTSQNQ